MTTLISDSTIETHDQNVSCDVNPFTDEKFGLLTLKFAKTSIVKKPVFILFTVDKTDSMNENANASDQKSKFHYVKETMKRMLTFLSKQEANVNIRVHLFNTDVEVFIENEKVTEDNVDFLVQMIDQLRAEGSTNIEVALRRGFSFLTDYVQNNPNHFVHHVFMTDGEATTGIKSPDLLFNIIDTSVPTTFIGFGKQHNVQLLRKLSSSELNKYEFIDNVEHTGIVYGSVLHEILYCAIRNMKIAVENGEVYDWRTDTWTNCLIEPTIVSEANKIYHMKIASPQLVEVKLSGIPMDSDDAIDLDNVFVLPDLEDMETGEMHSSSRVDLSKYMYRQAVQEIMFRSKSVINIGTFKNEISGLFRKLRRFMRTKDLLEDALLSQLCDDLCIVFRTIGTRTGMMFSLAREQSQGRQQSNTTTPRAVEPDFSDFGMARQNTVTRFIAPLLNCPDSQDVFEPITRERVPSEEIGADEDDIRMHITNDNGISCFAGSTAVDTMTQLST